MVCLCLRICLAKWNVKECLFYNLSSFLAMKMVHVKWASGLVSDQ